MIKLFAKNEGVYVSPSDTGILVKVILFNI